MPPFPPPPTSSIDWANVGFKVREVNGHISSTYSLQTQQWTSPEFVQSPFLPIHGFQPGLNYGQSAFEGLKAFRHPGDETIAIFRPDRNAKRMQNSVSYIAIPPVPEEHFLRCVRLAVALNAEFVPPHATGAAMYIRPLIFGSSAQLGLNPPEEYMFVVFVVPTGVYHGVSANDALVLTNFDRCAPEGTGNAKIAGNYGPVLIHMEAARKQGFGITLHLDSKTQSEIDEFSTCAFLGVRESKSEPKVTELVVPNSKNCIESVTAESVRQIAERKFGCRAVEESITLDKLDGFCEVIACGTAAALVPIKSITLRKQGEAERKWTFDVGSDNGPGRWCKSFSDEYKQIQRGIKQDEYGWCDIVRAPEQYGHLSSKEEDSKSKAVNGMALKTASAISVG